MGITEALALTGVLLAWPALVLAMTADLGTRRLRQVRERLAWIFFALALGFLGASVWIEALS